MGDDFNLCVEKLTIYLVSSKQKSHCTDSAAAVCFQEDPKSSQKSKDEFLKMSKERKEEATDI